METTPNKAERRVASTRSVKFLKNHVATPKNITKTHKPYHGAGYVAMAFALSADVSCLSFKSVKVLLTIMSPLFHRPTGW